MRKKYGGLTVSDVKRLKKELEDKNLKLKRLLADQIPQHPDNMESNESVWYHF